jgi:hypothetical protein
MKRLGVQVPAGVVKSSCPEAYRSGSASALMPEPQLGTGRVVAGLRRVWHETCRFRADTTAFVEPDPGAAPPDANDAVPPSIPSPVETDCGGVAVNKRRSTPAGQELRSGSRIGASERAIIHAAARDLVLHLFRTLPPQERRLRPRREDDGA